LGTPIPASLLAHDCPPQTIAPPWMSNLRHSLVSRPGSREKAA
jgi:hypothetical protein